MIRNPETPLARNIINVGFPMPVDRFDYLSLFQNTCIHCRERQVQKKIGLICVIRGGQWHGYHHLHLKDHGLRRNIMNVYHQKKLMQFGVYSKKYTFMKAYQKATIECYKDRFDKEYFCEQCLHEETLTKKDIACRFSHLICDHASIFFTWIVNFMYLHLIVCFCWQVTCHTDVTNNDTKSYKKYWCDDLTWAPIELSIVGPILLVIYLYQLKLGKCECKKFCTKKYVEYNAFWHYN